METVRDAATVILVRDRPDLHVFVLRRSHELVFAPGATVFPGGAVEADDIAHAATAGVDEFRVAAARERCQDEQHRRRVVVHDDAGFGAARAGPTTSAR